MPERMIVLATRNEGKTAEIREMLSDFNVDIKSLKDFGPIPDVVEDGDTFEDNAYKKAHFTAGILGIPAIADDSGLVVEELDGEPGVRSARYVGEGATDVENNKKLLEKMEGVTNRKARFECVIAIAVPRGPALIYDGRCEGEILHEPIGKMGFGYDPIFYYPPLKKSFAQLSREEKNLVSHRGKALADLKNEFDKVIIWVEQRLADEPF